MSWLRHVSMVVLIGFMMVQVASAARMNTTVESVEIGLGDSVDYPLIVSNPLDRPDTYDIGVGALMDSGSASAVIEGEDRTSDRIEVELGAGETMTLPVHYTGSACTSRNCDGTATFVGRSLETGERFSLSVDLAVRRDTEVYGSPGITALQAVFAGIIASILAAFWS